MRIQPDFWNTTNAVGGSFIHSLHGRCGLLPSRIPPTQLVDCSYIAYTSAAACPVSNTTNAVGGLFIHSLHGCCSLLPSRIPPTQLVDCSYIAYTGAAACS